MPSSTNPRVDRPASETSPLLQQRPVDAVTESSDRDDDEFSSGPAEDLSFARAALIWIAAGLIIFLQACNFSLLSTTQGAIAKDLDAYEYTTWLTASFLVPISSAGPIAGKLSQVFSPRRCVLFGCVAFAFGSVLSSRAHSVGQFLGGRAVTGVGAAFIINVLVIYILQAVSTKRRGAILGAVNLAVTTGTSLGAVLGGAFEPLVGWRPLFWVQAPMSLVSGVAVFLAIPSSATSEQGVDSVRRALHKLKKIDYLGAATLTGATTSLLIALSQKHISVALILVALALFPAFALIEAYFAKDPVVPIIVLRSRGALLSCFALLLFMIPRWALVFYTPVYAIAVRDWAPALAGLLLLPTTAGFGAGGLVSGTFHIRRTGSFYMPSVIAYTLCSLALLVLTYTMTPVSSIALFAAAMFLHGFFTGCATQYSLVHVLHLTPVATHTIVPSLHGLFRGSAGSFGAAIGGGIFGRVLHSELAQNFLHRGLPKNPDLLRQIAGNPRLVWQLSGGEHDAALEAYTSALRAVMLSGVAATLVAVVLQASTGWSSPDEDHTQAAAGESVQQAEAQEEAAAQGA